MAMVGGVAYPLGASWNSTDATTTMRLFVYLLPPVQNAGTNKSTLTAGLYVHASKGSIGNWAMSGTNQLTCEGVTKTSSTGASGSGIKWLIQNAVFEVLHGEDGTKSVVFSARWGASSSWGRVPITRTGDPIVLPAIPRGSKLLSTTLTAIELPFSCTTQRLTSVDRLTVVRYGQGAVEFPVKIINNYTNNQVVRFTDEEMLDMMKLIYSPPMKVYLKLILETFTDSTYTTQIGLSSELDVTANVLGTTYRNVDGVFKRGIMYEKIMGVWLPMIEYQNVLGTWKRGE